jgi:hypothetical protein
MLLLTALEKFKMVELKMSEIYLWCSAHFEDLDLRQFFADMEDEELGHARAFVNIAKDSRIRDFNIDIQVDLSDGILQKMEIQFELIKKKEDLNKIFLYLVELESSEVNKVFESIIKGVRQERLSQVDFMKVNTQRHILMLLKQTEILGLNREIITKIRNISIADDDYYKVFTKTEDPK